MLRFDRITINPAQMNAQPCIRGMWLTVRRVVKAVGLYPDRADLKREYPELEDEDIRQGLTFFESWCSSFDGSSASLRPRTQLE